MISGLIREHRAIETSAERLLRIVAYDSPDAASVAAMRWQMYRALIDHCVDEDRVVYDAMLASGDAEAVELAWASREELGTVGEEFRLYVVEWPVTRISREWSAFRVLTRDLLARLAARIVREEEQLYPVAERLQLRRAA